MKYILLQYSLKYVSFGMKYRKNQKYITTDFIHKVRRKVDAYKYTVHLERERKVYMPFLTSYELYLLS